MKKILLLMLIIPSLLLTGCSESSPFDKSYEVDANNYTNFFKIEKDFDNKKTVIKSKYNKHLVYTDVKFEFTSSYYYKESLGSSYTSTPSSHQYTVDIDETGRGSEYFVQPEHTNKSITSANFVTITLVKVEGKVSIDKEGATITPFESDSLTQSLTLSSYILPKQTELRYKANVNFDDSPNTDAFYVIDSVEVSFETIVNNVRKTLKYTFHPNLVGEDVIELEDDFDSQITNETFKVHNGFLIEYK